MIVIAAVGLVACRHFLLELGHTVAVGNFLLQFMTWSVKLYK